MNRSDLSKKPLPEAAFKQMAEAIRLLGHAQRLRIIEYLDIEGESKVGDIVDGVAMQQGAVSQHLRQMRMAGIITSRRDGRQVYYKISNASSVTILNCIRRQFEGADPDRF